MSSLPFLIGSLTPTKHDITTTTTPIKRLLLLKNIFHAPDFTEAEASAVKFSNHHHHHHKYNTSSSSSSSSNPLMELKKESPESSNFRRREAIGIIGLSFGFIDAIISTAAAEAITSSPCEFTIVDSGLGYCDKLVGTGPVPVEGQLIKAHYVGKLESGKVFDSSYNRGKPLTFRIGVGEVIKGWDEGILGGNGVPPMLAGGKRMLKLPPQLGYGMRGAGCNGGSCIIPPDSVLLFDVEFIGRA